MAYCFYNGVKLPELPSGVITNYPYCWIRKNDNTQHYDLLFTKILGYYDASLGGIEYGTSSGTTDIVHYRLAYSGAGSADGWDSYQTTNTWMALDANRTVMWSNHYIPNGSLTATEMYFDAHEAIPEVDAYQIEKETVVGIADQVRRLCNTEATMTPAVIKSNLEGLNIDLMETFVISGPEEQVIYPEDGYYGFSKITVGAVDTSGGGSIPDDEWDSAEDTTFGDDWYNVPTGNYDYSGGTAENPSYIPEIPGTGYKALFSQKMKKGKEFRYYVDGVGYDVKTTGNVDIYLYATNGFMLSDDGSYSLWSNLIAYSEEEFDLLSKKSTETAWVDNGLTSATHYDNGWFMYVHSSGTHGSPSNGNTYTPGSVSTEFTGVPVHNLGQFANHDDYDVARRNLATSSENGDSGSNFFIAFVSDTQILYDGSVINNTDKSPMVIYECDANDANTWTQVGTTDGTDYPTSGYSLVWNSHDLKDMEGLYVTNSKSDDPIAEMSMGDTGIPVERNETYSIEGNTVNTFVSAAQKVTGGKTPLTPTEAALALDEYQSHAAEEMKW